MFCGSQLGGAGLQRRMCQYIRTSRSVRCMLCEPDPDTNAGTGAESRAAREADSGDQHDNGLLFRATHVRVEGDDPLSALLDVSGEAAKLMSKISDAIAGHAPLSLHSKDHVSIYAVDCSPIQSFNDVPGERLSRRMAQPSLNTSARFAGNKLRPTRTADGFHRTILRTRSSIGTCPKLNRITALGNATRLSPGIDSDSP